MGIKYKMKKDMYDSIRFPMYWNEKEKKMMRSNKGMSKKEVLQYVNDSFGLLQEVTEIILI